MIGRYVKAETLQGLGSDLLKIISLLTFLRFRYSIDATKTIEFLKGPYSKAIDLLLATANDDWLACTGHVYARLPPVARAT